VRGTIVKVAPLTRFALVDALHRQEQIDLSRKGRGVTVYTDRLIQSKLVSLYESGVGSSHRNSAK
jgi:hypothetical protein